MGLLEAGGRMSGEAAGEAGATAEVSECLSFLTGFDSIFKCESPSKDEISQLKKGDGYFRLRRRWISLTQSIKNETRQSRGRYLAVLSRVMLRSSCCISQSNRTRMKKRKAKA